MTCKEILPLKGNERKEGNKIKIPNSIDICGIKYQICETDIVSREDPDLIGQIRYREQVILIDKNLKDDRKEQTLLHEVIHGILNELSYIDQDEKLVQGIAQGMHQFLKSNAISFS